jgi:hypothetical protein
MATVSTATLGSNLGTGGMETKLIAAEIATAAGVSTITTPSRHPASLFAILEYQGATSGSGSSGTNPITRPLHTLFKPSATPLRDLKAWTRHTLAPAAPSSLTLAHTAYFPAESRAVVSQQLAFSVSAGLSHRVRRCAYLCARKLLVQSPRISKQHVRNMSAGSRRRKRDTSCD